MNPLELNSDFLNLIYPKTCAACGYSLKKQEEIICLKCQYNLPKTNHHEEEENPIAKKFWGRVPLENAASFYYFGKKGRVQQLIHHLKYGGWPEVGLKIGQMYGVDLSKHERFQDIKLVLPIPLHPQKKAKRGYNQRDFFAEGLAKSMKIEWSADAVIRKVFTESQTKKDRFERWENVESIFGVAKPELLENKHILLVDDVITTGSTIEACANEILKVKNVRLSVVSIATAQS